MILLGIVFWASGYAQYSHYSSGEILLKLHKLNVLGNALYVAAHPDDENTRMIAYLANDRLVNTAYLSLTRGDGGQNLIGPELREGLGLIRTQELLAARRLDGGNQYFSRANDFGYSKNSTETLKIWDEDEVLSDVVWVYRNFKPDVVITRFPPDARAGHGHHTSSAIMAERAFEVSGDESVYTEQLEYVEPWTPKRIFMNSGRWWDPDVDQREGTIKIDVGAYSPFLGLSYSEIAADSRSQHKSQGFGNARSRGESIEYLILTDGDPADADLFEGIDTSWDRVNAGHITAMVSELIDNFDAQHPDKSVNSLLLLRKEVQKVENDFWRNKKLAEIDHLILDCTGLYLGAWAEKYRVIQGEALDVNLEMINRSPLTVSVESIKISGEEYETDNPVLADNQRINQSLLLKVPEDEEYSSPYWLNEQASLGMYSVTDQLQRGKPENDPAFNVDVDLDISGQIIKYSVPVVYRWTDRVKGELFRPVRVVPEVSVSIDDPVVIFSTVAPRDIAVTIHANTDDVSGEVSLQLEKGWKSSPESQLVTIEKSGLEKTVIFRLTPPKKEAVSEITARMKIDGKVLNQTMQTIEYDHIPYQLMLPKSSFRAVRETVKSEAQTVGYIMGAGDAVPQALEQLGIDVLMLSEEDITSENLADLDAVIFGVRAVNTERWLLNKKPILMDYVNAGGSVVFQYNTTRTIDWNTFSPYELKFTGRSSDSRVAEEDAEVRILAPDHRVMNSPNKITSEDFDGWVQERGLYFPNEWSDEFTAILSANDQDEPPLDGGLLVAKYGEGYFVYTGYSWFRELPAGVPGAFKLFANIISLSGR